MTEDHAHPARQIPIATLTLIALNVLIYCAMEWAARKTNYPIEQFALSRNGLQHGRWWELITYQFLHAPMMDATLTWRTLLPTHWPWHLLLNCWCIFIFGPPVEFTLGKRNFVMLYLAAGVAGGLLQIVASVLSHHFGGPVVGASAGLFGLVAAFSTLFPDARMFVLVMLVIPLRVKANTLLSIAIGITAAGLFVNGMWPNLAINRIAHAAHLGGLIAGLVFLRWKMRSLFVPQN
ncbi:MAG TPA: rhomboid family intramembrane serine protease [Candidatus Acidoferrum sp.]|nr:rhomboid family intramembrane serine protease [Candidatus Acidoferrum sp.]